MEQCAPPTGATETWLAAQRFWAQGWRRLLVPAVFLAYLIAVGQGVQQYSHGLAALAGYALIAAFCAAYLGAMLGIWSPTTNRFWPFCAATCVICAAELPFARASAFVMCSFICVLLVTRLGLRCWPAVVVLTAASLVVPPLVPSWKDHLSTSLDNGTAIAIPLVAAALFGFNKILESNQALAAARFEIARLAAENERSRIARDLHDLLGHSLTTITVKAGLARRLGASDVEAALEEIAEVEALSRRALGDVRAAVANYREVTLTGELATGRELLRAAGIEADFPGAVDVVDGEVQELFGWVLREGLTNVVRHSHAGACTVRISPSSVEILDDGIGGTAAAVAAAGVASLPRALLTAGGAQAAGGEPVAGGGSVATVPDEDAGRNRGTGGNGLSGLRER
ncbi:MAG TPA: histidine kinase, partial [Acidimicrobiales bacterium]|nr:histidine kinase [Acidimicrobiales bacterium]